MRFLLLLAQHYEDFRLSELQSIAEMENIGLDLSNYREDSPFVELDLPSEDDARRLVARSFLSRAIYRIYAQGTTMEEVHAQNKTDLTAYDEIMTKSFKVEFSSFQGSRSSQDQLRHINDLAYLKLQGPIRMKNPEVRLVFVESYRADKISVDYVWFTKHITDSARSAMDVYDLKKRKHVGTTSFEAELAFVTTNMAQVRKYDFVYDPFAGTGSFPLAAAYHGAAVIASDIDIRPLRKYPVNFSQYGTSQCLIDAMEMDFTHNALHERIKLDAIICDPPYGVRERIVVCGAAKPERFVGKENVVVGNELSHLRRDYIATKKPYDLTLMMRDLFEFASERLNVGRRLSFWLPLEEEEAETTKIPLHKDLEFKYISVQKFSKWERWLLTYERRPLSEQGPEQPLELDNDFREKYLRRFNKKPE